MIWAVHFGVIYTITALACARGDGDSVLMALGGVRTWVIGATALALLAAAAVLFLALRDRKGSASNRHERPVQGFLAYTTATLAALSLLAILWNGLPVLIVPPCG